MYPFLTGGESIVNGRGLSRKDRKILGDGESINKGRKKRIKVPDACVGH